MRRPAVADEEAVEHGAAEGLNSRCPLAGSIPPDARIPFVILFLACLPMGTCLYRAELFLSLLRRIPHHARSIRRRAAASGPARARAG